MQIYRHIGPFIRENIGRYIIGMIMLFIIGALQLVTPWIIGAIVDKIVDRTLDFDFTFTMISTIFVVEFIVFGSRYLWRSMIFGNARRIEHSVRQKLFGHFETLSLNYYIQNKTGDLMARATNDLEAMRMALGPGVMMIFDVLFLTVLTIFMMVTRIDAQLTLYALIPLPFLAVIILGAGKLIQNRFRAVNEAFSSISERARETFSGIRIIKTFVRENAAKENFNIDNANMLKQNFALVRVFGAMMPLIMFIASTSMVIALYVGGNSVLDHQISLGQFVTFITYLGLLTWPFMAIGWVVNVLQRGTASLKRINELFDEMPEINDDESDAEFSRIYGDIQFKDLSFAYPDDVIPTLKHINLKIKRGQTVAILGRTGAGKSTITNLLLRLYNPPRSTVFIDGKDIRSIPLGVLRSHIGYVPQNSFLFGQTIRENIAITDDDTKDKKIAHYAKIAAVRDEIEALEDGYNTMLGERGVNLSGGQKQRVAIARALIKNPDLIILDDSLSAVDTKTEASILGHLRETLKDKTSIIVSHRVSSIKHADQIIVLEDGRITQLGTHDTLLQEDGFYKSLYQKQQLESKIASYEN